jgi:futalosine hydrolase
VKVLLVSATQAEIAPLLKTFQNATEFSIGRHQVRVLITGVGMVATAFSMGAHLSSNAYEVAINTGIAGAFDRNSELGAEDGEDFLPIDKLGFGQSVIHPLQPAFPLPAVREVRAITVSRVHGNETTIYHTMSRLHPQVESMEGAAFFYSCNQLKLPSVQLRAVSNYVERRNVSQWNIPEAIEKINSFVISYLEKL